MSYTTIRDAIDTLLLTIADISGGDAIVTEFLVQAITQEDFVTFFKELNANRIHAWYITRDRLLEREEIQTVPLFRLTHGFRIEGFLALKDNGLSEQGFNVTIDNIHDKFRGDKTIWVEHPREADQAIDTEFIGHKMINGILVHHAIMRLDVEEQKTGA